MTWKKCPSSSSRDRGWSGSSVLTRGSSRYSAWRSLTGFVHITLAEHPAPGTGSPRGPNGQWGVESHGPNPTPCYCREEGAQAALEKPQVNTRLGQKQKLVPKVHTISCGFLGTTNPAGGQKLEPPERWRSLVYPVPTCFPASAPTGPFTPAINRSPGATDCLWGPCSCWSFPL